MSLERLSLGKRGEMLAADLLKREGYRLLERNWRGVTGEIDLVAEDGDCLVFVEVKTRRSLACGEPLEGIDARKRHQLARVAREYLSAKGGEERICRFDAVAVLDEKGSAPRLELVRNAFDLPGEFF